MPKLRVIGVGGGDIVGRWAFILSNYQVKKAFLQVSQTNRLQRAHVLYFTRNFRKITRKSNTTWESGQL